MTKLTKEQLIEDLKASTQNASGMFEIGEETICELVALLTEPSAPVSVPDLKPVGFLFVSDDGAVAYSPAGLPMKGFNLIGPIYGDVNACSAAMLQAGNHTEQHLDMVNSQVIQDDVSRMDWLVSKTVDVREPMAYGSHSLFWSQTITDEEDDYHATKLREQIDAAMAVEQAAAQQHSSRR